MDRQASLDRRTLLATLAGAASAGLAGCSGRGGETSPAGGERDIRFTDGSTQAAFGSLDYRVYYPASYTGTTYPIHVSRGGNGSGDDRGKLESYVRGCVEDGYVVVQIDHRNARLGIERIARFRGEEIAHVANEVANGEIVPEEFEGTVDGSRQGFIGHSGGCMEGLQAAGTTMTHGDYTVPELKAVYGISPAGYDPDQFGIEHHPPGFEGIDDTATFVAIGEEETDTNGPGQFQADGWRLQAYDAMDVDGPRYEAIIRGPETDHIDMAGRNPDIHRYNVTNALELFATDVRRSSDGTRIGERAKPPDNTVILSRKGV
jgi:hypothetical protein